MRIETLHYAGFKQLVIGRFKIRWFWSSWRQRPMYYHYFHTMYAIQASCLSVYWTKKV